MKSVEPQQGLRSSRSLRLKRPPIELSYRTWLAPQKLEIFEMSAPQQRAGEGMKAV